MRYLLQNPSLHLSHRQAQWVEKMQQFRFEFIYLKKETNKVADALSYTLEFECSAVEVHRALQLCWKELVEAARSDASYPTSKLGTARGLEEGRGTVDR